jgi:hypothetical protein
VRDDHRTQHLFTTVNEAKHEHITLFKTRVFDVRQSNIHKDI